MRKKRFLAALMAAAMAVIVPVTSAAAATYDNVNTWDKMMEAFNYDGDDADVTIILSDNIEWYAMLQAKEGKVYTINGKTYVLTNVQLGGSGTVHIDGADLDGEDSALSTADSVTVNVTGEDVKITAEYDGIEASGNSSVTVDADITSGDDGVQAYGEASVTVNGDIDSTYGVYGYDNAEITVTGDIASANQSVYAGGNTDITVNGDVTSDYDGVYAYGESTVTVNGDIAADYDGVDVEEKANVTVNGNITAGEDGVYAEGYYGNESTVTVNGDITADGDGVYADDKSNVTVNGDITSDDSGVESYGQSTVTVVGDVAGSYDGVEAYDESNVTVDGNVSGTDGYYDEETGEFDYSGYGVEASDNATVTITGDVTGGDFTYSGGSEEYAGDGVCAYDESTVTVGGNVSGGNMIVEEDPESGNMGSDQYDSYAGAGVWMDSTANVTVGGDVTGGSNNQESGHAGNGAYIMVTMKELDVPAGSLQVAGLVSGGSAAGENGVDGNAVFYRDDAGIDPDDAHIDENYIPGQDGTDYMGWIEFMYFEAAQQLAEAASYIGYSEDEAQALYEEIQAQIESIYEDETGEALNPDTPPEAFFEEMTDAERDAMIEEWITLYNKVVDDLLLQLYAVPEVTVWGVSAEEGTDAYESELELLTAEILGADVNYIVKIAETANGTVSVDKETAKAGETVVVTPKANEDSKLVKVLLNGEELTAVDGVYSFVMPENGGIEVSAEFEKIVKETPEDNPEDTTLPGEAIDQPESKPATGTGSSDGAPDTADNSPIASTAMLMAVSAVCAGAAVVVGRKKRTN